MSGSDRSCVEAMWHAAGCPPPDFVPRKRGETVKEARLPERFDGVCAITGSAGPVWAAGGVVSDNFADWDRCPFRHRLPSGFSDPLAWAFRNPAFVWQAHVLDSGGLRPVNAPGVYAALMVGVDYDAAIILPISGKKHVAPFAIFGAVNTDNRAVSWSVYDVERLQMLARVRSLGFGEQMLVQPAPPWPILRKHSPSIITEIVAAWEELRPWRDDDIYMTIGCLATRKPKKGTDGDS